MHRKIPESGNNVSPYRDALLARVAYYMNTLYNTRQTVLGCGIGIRHRNDSRLDYSQRNRLKQEP